LHGLNTYEEGEAFATPASNSVQEITRFAFKKASIRSDATAVF